VTKHKIFRLSLGGPWVETLFVQYLWWKWSQSWTNQWPSPAVADPENSMPTCGMYSICRCTGLRQQCNRISMDAVATHPCRSIGTSTVFIAAGLCIYL